MSCGFHRSNDVKQMQNDQLAMQEQLEAAEDRAKVAQQQAAVHQQQKGQLFAACQPILAWVSQPHHMHSQASTVMRNDSLLV